MVELLVVMVIVGLLASLLLPALAASRSAARTTQDASNLRQLTLAWLRAQQTTGDRMMPWMTQDVVNEPNYPRYWFGALDKSQAPWAVVFKDGFLAPFLEIEQRVFQDPDFGPDNVTETRYNTFTTSYGYNTVLGPGTSLKYDASYNVVGVWPPGYTIQTGDDASGTYPVGTIIPPVGRAFASVKYTSRTIVFADSAGGYDPTTYAAGQLTESWALQPPAPGSQYASYPTLHYRHGGRIANVSFADGHVEQARMSSRRRLCGTATGNRRRLRGSPGSTSKTLASLGSTIRRTIPAVIQRPRSNRRPPFERSGARRRCNSPAGPGIFSKAKSGRRMRKNHWTSFAMLAAVAGGGLLWAIAGGAPSDDALFFAAGDHFAQGDLRIVSLAPSVTEILFALGSGGQLVGATDHCDYPPEAKRIERVGGFGAPSVEKLLDLHPDLVIAAGFERGEIAQTLRQSGIRTLDVPRRELRGIVSFDRRNWLRCRPPAAGRSPHFPHEGRFRGARPPVRRLAPRIASPRVRRNLRSSPDDSGRKLVC